MKGMRRRECGFEILLSSVVVKSTIKSANEAARNSACLLSCRSPNNVPMIVHLYKNPQEGAVSFASGWVSRKKVKKGAKDPPVVNKVQPVLLLCFVCACKHNLYVYIPGQFIRHHRQLSLRANAGQGVSEPSLPPPPPPPLIPPSSQSVKPTTLAPTPCSH